MVEGNWFENTKNALFSEGSSDKKILGGCAFVRNNYFGPGVEHTAPNGTFTSPPYSYTQSSLDSVKSVVSSSAGVNLNF